tara:strand:+ start:65 stop:853 length:789 start_codon:yes stop_codon:yes gene_type:complete
MKNTLFHGDCLELLDKIESGSIDAVIADPPYGTTACNWDSIIPLDKLWSKLERVLKHGAPVVLFGNQPFTSKLIMSNIKHFKYEWIYEKTNPKGFLSAKRRPLTAHENIVVFCSATPPYFPQKWEIPEQLRTKRKHATAKTSGQVYGARNLKRYEDNGERFPTSVIGFSNRVGRSENYHPTQKPIDLMLYLVETYTVKGDCILDFSMGSGTTGVAALMSERRFVGIEKEKDYFDAASARMNAVSGLEQVGDNDDEIQLSLAV